MRLRPVEDRELPKIEPVTQTVWPWFKSKVRSGGDVDVITLPRTVSASFNIQKGDVLTIEIRAIEKNKSNLWSGSEGKSGP